MFRHFGCGVKNISPSIEELLLSGIVVSKPLLTETEAGIVSVEIIVLPPICQLNQCFRPNAKPYNIHYHIMGMT